MSDIDSKFLKFCNIEYVSTSLNSTVITINIDHKQGESPRENFDITIVDLQFYSQDYLSLLILNRQTRTSSLIQVPLHDGPMFECENDSTVALNDIIGGTWPRPFQGISARRLAVSGPRKVAAILSENNRKIRLLETEAEPEDEEDDDEEEVRLLDNMMDTTPSVNFSAEITRSNSQGYY